MRGGLWTPALLQAVCTSFQAAPTCARCRRPVERVNWKRCEDTCHWLVTVHCHGESQTQRLADVDVCNAESIRFGEAFTETAVATVQPKPGRPFSRLDLDLYGSVRVAPTRWGGWFPGGA